MGQDGGQVMDHDRGVEELSLVGEGKEFRVIRPRDKLGVVYKVPKEITSWARKDMSTVDYQMQMANRLRELGFSDYLPLVFRKIFVDGLGEVIESEDLTEGGKNLVLAIEELGDVSDPTMRAKLRRFPIKSEAVREKVKEIRRHLLGAGGEGLIDQAAKKNIVVGADSYQVIIKPDGGVRVVINDFGTVVGRTDLDHKGVNDANYGFTVGLINKLLTLARSLD